MGAPTRNYSAASFALELEGTAVGFLRTVEGGEPVGTVVEEAADSSGIVKKHVGTVVYQPIVISFGAGMASVVYQWISDVLSRKAPAKSGAIIFADYNYKETSRIEFDQALVTEISFPAVDAQSKDMASFTLTLQPQVTRTNTTLAGNSVSGFGTKTLTKLNVGNFLFKISGLEIACARINAVNPIVVQQPVIAASGGTPRKSAPVDVQNFEFTVAESHGKDFVDWADDFLVKGNNTQASERSGSLEYRDPTHNTALFTLAFSNLGIVKAYRLRSEEGATVLARIGVELYCEQMSFSIDPAAAGSTTKSSSDGSQPASSGSSAALTNTLIGIIAGRFTAEEALLGTAKPVGSDMPATKLVPEVIAKRLLLTARPPMPGPVVPKRKDGIALGQKWATDTATIDELKQIAVANQGDWSALNLSIGHTLVDSLRGQGLVPEGVDGPLQLERDPFVEGIVAGATGVLNDASPHLPSAAG